MRRDEFPIIDSYVKKEINAVLDKIRDEIKQTAIDFDEYEDYRRVRGLWIALDIVDKYR